MMSSKRIPHPIHNRCCYAVLQYFHIAIRNGFRNAFINGIISLSSQLPYSFIKKNSFWKSKLNPLTLQAYAILLWRPIPVLASKSSCFKNTSQIGCRLKLQFSGLLQRCVVLLSSILRIMNTHSSNPPLLSLWMTQLFFLQMLEWINISLSFWDRFYCEIASDS